ncbi:MAG: DEAD/DEAH box helicase, partial [Deltaproteobacteria bacterium]|nr:DEAD/DEAH box helicase [Deltaproteobacteria bacterium]
RAAFKAVMDGKQVAVLVPTTILAEQHFQTFTKRFDQYPVRIEVLNRYKTAREQRAIVDDLNRGLVDIVIGAHRLLQKDVEFKDLGLVVIDEEQRFGVAHKERLKKLRTLVDILTLTATPIPRTLQLSLVGIRDLSVIETPPEERQAATVFIAEFDDDVIAPAIRREFQRCGQVFFVHDRVQSIHRVARYLAGLVPEARIGIAHGQMKPRELEDVMIRFLRKELNLLVCTTIISSGVDVPSANTILINRADRFGLAQLYQLRGRVGRSKEEAFVYFLVPKGARITGDALKRLQVAQEFSEPGSGFKVATHDLEIRGGGNLLGVSQSGHISAVGFELYTELMETAVRELRGDRKPELEIRPEIHLGFPAFIPDEYIADMHLRLLTYKKISIASDDEEIAKIREELQDCYGVFPPEVRNLIAVIALRNRMKACLVTKVSYDGRTLAVSFHEQAKVDPAKIVELTKRYPRNLVVSPEGRLTLRPPALETDRVVGFIEDFLRDAGLVACETACRGGAVD